jgi:peptidoglycan/xylan/chitin deacetylase (PgdA/CDA1 family)
MGDSSLHLPLPAFIRQVEHIARTHDVVTLDDALASSPGSRTHRRPRAVLTFDDAYRGAVTLALPELERRGLPATVFVAPALLGTTSTWWDDLGAAGILTDSVRNESLHQHAGRADDVRRAFLTGVPRLLPSSFGIATEQELRAGTGAGITIGSHSWAHEHLPSLAEDELTQNLRRTLQWLEASGMDCTRWLSLPYGATSDQVERSAIEVGHTGVLLVSGGRMPARTSGPRVPRINIPAGMSTRGLELRLSGLKG